MITEKDSKGVVLFDGCPQNWPSHVVAYTDGASRGNPGKASLGVRVESEQGKMVFEEAQSVGVLTNNEAEYLGVHRVLELSAQNQVKKLCLKTDSQLVVRQLKGEYKIKAPRLKPLYLQCLDLIKQIEDFSIVHVPRESNTRADELANIALDADRTRSNI